MSTSLQRMTGRWVSAFEPTTNNVKVVPMMQLVKIICSLFDARRRRGGAF